MPMNEREEYVARMYAKKMAQNRTFQFGADNRIHVGRKAFDGPAEAFEYLNSIGLKSYAHFAPDQFPLDVPRNGPSLMMAQRQYMEALQEIPGMEGATVDVMSFNMNELNYRNVLKELTDEQGRVRGTIRPNQEELQVIRVYRPDGSELLDTEIDRLNRTQGMRKFAEKEAKVFKRMAQLTNDEQFGVAFGRELKLHAFSTFNGEEIAGNPILKYGLDGQAIGNPKLLGSIAGKLESEARSLERDLKARRGTMTADEIDKATRDISSIRDNARKLREARKTGGTFEAFRTSGLIDPVTSKKLEGLAKGDIIFPSQAAYKAAHENIARTYGLPVEDVAKTELFVPSWTDPVTGKVKGNLTQELSMWQGQKRNFLTLRMNEAMGAMRMEIQTLVGMGEKLYDLPQILEANERYYMEEIARFERTGRLPEGFIKNLRELAAREGGSDGQTALSFIAQKRRAETILKMHDAGIPVAGDAVRDFFNGLKKSLSHKKNPKDPFFYLPGTVGAHIRAAENALPFGIIDELPEPGEIMFRKNYGVMMRTEDIYKSYNRFQGFDLDDLLRNHLRWVTDGGEDGAGEFRIISTRNPASAYEGANMAFRLEKNMEFLEVMAEAYPDREEEIREVARNATQADRRIKNLTRRQQALISEKNYGQDLADVIDQVEEARLTLRDYNARGVALAKELVPHTSRSQIANIVAELEFSTDPNEAPKLIRHPAMTTFEKWLNPDGAPKRDISYMEDALKSQKIGEQIKEARKVINGSSELSRHALDQIESNIITKGMLGRYVNADTMLSTMITQLEDMSPDAAAGIRGIIGHTSPEQFIDSIIQGTGDIDVSEGNTRILAMMEGMAEMIAKHDLKISQSFFASRYQYLEDDAFTGAAKGDAKFFLKRLAYHSEGRITGENFAEHIFIPEDSKYNFLDRAFKLAEEFKQQESLYIDEAKQRMVLPDAIKKTFYSFDEEVEAERLSKLFVAARKQFRADEAAAIDLDPRIAGLAEEIGRPNEHTVRARSVFLQGLSEHFEDGVFGEKAQRIMGAVMKKHSARTAGLFSSGILFEMQATVMGKAVRDEGTYMAKALQDLHNAEQMTRAATLAGELDEAETYSKEANEIASRIRNTNALADRRVSMDQIRVFHPDVDDEVPENLKRYLDDTMKPPPGTARQQRMAAAAAKASDLIDSNYKRISKEGLVNFVQKPGIRKTLIGMAGITAFSVLYQKAKDRTPEDMQGPPLLPGGSAYEQLPEYPQPPIDPRPMSSTESGMSYRIIADGSYDPDQLQQEIQSLTGGFVNANYYEGQSGRIQRPRGIAFSSMQRIQQMMEDM